MIRALTCSLLLLALLPVAAMAQKRASELLPGTWKAKLELDEEGAKKLLSAQGVDEQKAAQFLPVIKAQIEKMSFTVKFDEQGSMSFTPSGTPEDKETKFKYEIVSEDKGKIVLKTINANGNAEEHKLQFKGIDGDQFELELSKEFGPIPVKRPLFKRVKEGAS